eukprot:9294722-Lingulodinium_polyedra.AAC.1
MYISTETDMRPAIDRDLRSGEQAPSLTDLGDDRITVCVYRNGESTVLKDQWRSSLPQRLPLRGWV